MSFRNISAWAIRNPVPPIVLFLALTIAGIVTTPSSTNGANFCRHERLMPRARRIDALVSAHVAAPRRPRRPS